MDKDIQEMFRKKNREMLIHNLELDIERNIAVLEDTFTNIFNYQFDTGIRNIISILSEKEIDKEITTIMITLKNNLFTALKNRIDERCKKLLDRVQNLEFEEDKMEEYYEFVFSSSNDVKNFFESDDVSALLQDTISEFDKLIKNHFEEETRQIVESRIYDYIHYRLFGKLVERISSEILIRDNNLANKGKESYEKFQELESKTSC